jgi:hypothetical protein
MYIVYCIFPRILGGFLHICTCTCTIYCGLWPPDNTSCIFLTWYQSYRFFSHAQLMLRSNLTGAAAIVFRPLSPCSSSTATRSSASAPSVELLRLARLGIRRPPWPLSDQSPIPPSARVAVADQRRSVQEPLSLGSPPRESAGLVLARSLLLLSLGSLLGPRSIPPRDSSSAWIGLPARPDFRSLLLAPSAAVCPRTCPDRIDPQRRPLALFPH